MGEAMARKTDPEASHQAARDLVRSGAHRTQSDAVLGLLEKYPGRSCKGLYALHVRESQAPGGRLFFVDSTALQRRLSDCARRGAPAFCEIARKRVATWFLN